MKTCYTAIFGNYEELKDPTVITPGWEYICFTDQPLKSNIWKVVQVPLIDTPQRTARYYKILFQEHIKTKYSMWVDASFYINCDLNKWWEERFKVSFSCATHPIRNDVFMEARACINNKRGDADEIKLHIEKYIDVVPNNNGLITSGILLRENTFSIRYLCRLWWNELKNGCSRDQISFAKVSMEFSNVIHTYNWDYRYAKDFEFKTHYHRR